MLRFEDDDPITQVVNIKSGTHYDVLIDRRTIWGNPFSHRRGTQAKFLVENREEAIECYRNYILESPHLLSKLGELRGKTLACHCKPKSCHGDVLVWLCSLREENGLYRYP